MKACFLSNSEATQLEHSGIVPSCDNHIHVSFNEASLQVEEELWRWVVAADDTSKRRVTPTPLIVQYAGRPSIIRNGREILGVVTVMQAVVK